MTLVAGVLVLALSSPALAADGDLDPSFGDGGLAPAGQDSGTTLVAVQGDGKILAGGNVPGGDISGSITRLTTSGAVDTTFGGDGTVTVHTPGGNDLDDIEVQPDGRILATASARPLQDGDVVVFRFNPDGSRDTTFGGDGEVLFDFAENYSFPSALLVQPDGRIVVVGGGTSRNFDAARLNPDGSLDETFSGDGRVSVDLGGDSEAAHAVALQGGRLVLVGSSNLERSRTSPRRAFVALALTTAGARDASFGAAGDGSVIVETGAPSFPWDVAVTPGGGLVLSGSGEGWTLVKLDAGGRLDPGFSGDGRAALALDGVAWSVATTLDGKLAVAGTAGGDYAVAKLTQAGELELTFGDGGLRIYGRGRAWDLTRQADGKLLLGVSRDFSTLVARIHDSGSSPPDDPEVVPPPETPAPQAPLLELTAGPTVVEGQIAVFTATLSRASDQPVTFSFITGEGTAATGRDFGGRRGTLTIPPGQTSATIGIATNSDRFFENDESFRVELSNAVNARFGEYVAFTTILNDLRPGRCQNIVEGDRRTDILTGSSAGDLIIGRQDGDVLFGLGGPDCIRGERGHDIIDAGDGDDLVDGGSGDDELKGGDGHDRLYGRRGINRYNGGSGDDRIYARNGRSEIVECGGGRDTVKVDRNDRLRRCEIVAR